MNDDFLTMSDEEMKSFTRLNQSKHMGVCDYFGNEYDISIDDVF